jgi:hypothetical protein
MILLIALSLAQVPPPPSGRVLDFGDVEIVEPIAPMVQLYSRCLRRQLDQRGGMNMSDRARYRRSVDAAIGACAGTRDAEMAEADRALASAPDYRDPARRGIAIRHAFLGSDQQLRDMPEIIDRLRSRQAEAR